VWVEARVRGHTKGEFVSGGEGRRGKGGKGEGGRGERGGRGGGEEGEREGESVCATGAREPVRD
jgi:hypothetical protein